MKEQPLKVTLTEPEFAGDYIVAERGPDGSVQLVRVVPSVRARLRRRTRSHVLDLADVSPRGR